MKKGFWHKLICGQYGGISPFMFGLLLGVSIFSIAVQKRADIEMDEMRKKQLERQETEVGNLRKAVELAVMTENINSKTHQYKAIPDENRIAASATYSTGTTRTGQKVYSNAATDGAQNQYGRMIISTTDDAYTRDSLDATKGATFSALGSSSLQQRSDTVVVDTTSLRNEQVSISYKNMEALAGVVYNWWATPGNGFSFPSQAAYSAEVFPVAPYRDFWGQDFVYERIDQNRATLSFTPPWGGDAYVISLDMACSNRPPDCPVDGGACSSSCIFHGTSGGSSSGLWAPWPSCACVEPSSSSGGSSTSGSSSGSEF